MNLLENYIIKIHSVNNVTEQFEKSNGYLPEEPLYKVDLTSDCYGQIERKTKYFFQTDWDEIKERNYYLA